MKNNTIQIFIMFLCFLNTNQILSANEGVYLFKEINQPVNIEVDHTQLYVSERSQVSIYSLKDFQLLKRFGKKGEGPGEFMGTIEVILQPDHLFINSTGKISYFSKNGDLQKEIKLTGGITNGYFRPLVDGFVGVQVKLEDNIIYRILNLYDNKIQIVKEITRVKYPLQRQGDFPILETTFDYEGYKNSLFIADQHRFQIKKVDTEGNMLLKITRPDFSQRLFTDRDEKEIRVFFKTQLKERYETRKERFSFPKYFPAVWFLLPVDEKLYIITWNLIEKKHLVFIYNLNGKLIKKILLPIVHAAPLEPYPVTIKSNTLYQLIENPQTEAWELHITSIHANPPL